MNFAILRIDKIKSMNQLVSANKHNARIEFAANIDSSKSDKNKVINRHKCDPAQALQKLLDKYKIKARKNAVLALEHVLTFSPDARKGINLKDWANENVKFIESMYGRENVLQIALHLDESTPHLHVITAPIIEKEFRGKQRFRLDASHFVDGRQKLSEIQTKYADYMSKFNLNRGLKDSRRQRETLKEYNRKASEVMRETQQAIKSIEDEAQSKSFMSFSKYKTHLLDVTSKLKSALVTIAKLKKKNKALEKLHESISEKINSSEQLERKVAQIVSENVSLQDENSALQIKNDKLELQIEKLTKTSDVKRTYQRTHEHSNDLSM